MVKRTAKPQIEHLLVIDDNKGRRNILLDSDMYSLGRSPRCDIRLHSQFVSRHHATLLRLQREDGSEYYRIIDGEPGGRPSANGMLVNDRKVASHDLKHGDELVFGPQASATYVHKQRDVFPTIPPDDPFDITLIDPAMMDKELKDKLENLDLPFSDRDRD